MKDLARIVIFVCFYISIFYFTTSQAKGDVLFDENTSVNSINQTIRIGFIFDENLDSDKISKGLELAIAQSNHNTYQNLGIHLTHSVNIAEDLGFIQETIPQSVIQQIRNQDAETHRQETLAILDDTETDILFYVTTALGNTCGTAETPSLPAHFNRRIFMGAIHPNCIRDSVLSHEIGHMFGAHHDIGSDNLPHILANHARGCITETDQGEIGSIMSYAENRTSHFSSPNFCQDGINDNESLITENAKHVATMYERFKDNFSTYTSSRTDSLESIQSDQNNQENENMDKGGSFSFSIFYVLIIFLTARDSIYLFGKRPNPRAN